ncbi:MAG: TetR/AcrR family transcriptional regulator [Verrucomicrobiota bacterium]
MDVTNKPTKGDVRAAIIDAAETVLARDGIKHLSQTKVAKEAGVRQSHLTYYFPQKKDLVAGLLQVHIDQMETGADSKTELTPAFEMIIHNLDRIRFFLGLIVECEQNDDLRTLLSDHTQQFERLVARYFNRPAKDRDVELFLNTLRGCGMMNLLYRDSAPTGETMEIAKRFGLI